MNGKLAVKNSLCLHCSSPSMISHIWHHRKIRSNWKSSCFSDPDSTFPHQFLHHLRQGANGHGSLRLAQDIKESVTWQQGRCDSNCSDSQCLGMHADFGDSVQICADDNGIMRNHVLPRLKGSFETAIATDTTCSQAPRCLNCPDGLQWWNSASWDLLLCLCTFGYYGKGEGISSPITWWPGEVPIFSAGCLGLWTIIIVSYVVQRYVNMINYDYIYIYDYKLCTVDRIQRCSTDNSWSWFSYDQGEMASWNDHVLFYQSTVDACRRSKLQHFLARSRRFRIQFTKTLIFVKQDLSIFVAAFFQDVWT